MRNSVPAALLAALALAFPVSARDSALHFPVSAAIAAGRSQGILDGSVQFYFAGQKTPAIAKRFGESVSNRKTNAVGKSDSQACEWVMLSALQALQEEAKARNANAVIDIVSYYKKRTYSSATEYECHAGGIMAGVALKGSLARIDSR